ncbi:hypothetical protein ABZS66_60900 [Dactylosporangium sp. NPDC005572]|uniref:hypothetical protein n=1 Tax=Dactylosporangium sp. NPDC005572 TaxID=3156889 RepID=UPI0033B94F9B
MSITVAARVPLAGLFVLAALAGCGSGPPGPPPVSSPTRFDAGPRQQPPSPTPQPIVSTSGPAVRRPPTVRSIRSVPETVDIGCPPRVAPEGPEVLAEVDPGDYRLDEIQVLVQYSGGDERYQGKVAMRYDGGRKAYVRRLPPVSTDNIPPTSNGIAVTVNAVPDNQQRPPWIVIPGSMCLGAVGN